MLITGRLADSRLRFINPSLLLLLVVVAFGFSGTNAQAAEFRIINADTRLLDGVYRLNAEIHYDLTAPVREALLNGIALVFEVQIEVLRGRSYWWDSSVAELNQSHRLTYHALSRQFVIENLNTGLQQTFPDLPSALRQQGILRQLPLIDAALLNENQTYTATMQARLALNELPLPIRVSAYLSRAWQLGTRWHTWVLS
ncbi:MAG: DUF4390 domain-containing protein [Gammaproteobacteria bacterium]|nr:DUF4390 domain-containing protein [Gammaproteobacteria bacterium]